MTNKTVAFFFVISIAFIIFLLLKPKIIGNYTKTATTNLNLSFDFIKEKEILENMFLVNGSKETYEYFKISMTTYDPYEVHFLAHYVGDKIYRLEGLGGLEICDFSFLYGCYHGFIARALLEDPNNTIRQLERICDKYIDNPLKYDACFHGMGHGIVAYEGYNFDDMLQVLDRCDLLSKEMPRQFCYSGVFMERNLNIMHAITENNVLIRKFDADKAHEPCSKLPSKFQFTCYWQQVVWWSRILDNDFEKMHVLCMEIKNFETQNICMTAVQRIANDSKLRKELIALQPLSMAIRYNEQEKERAMNFKYFIESASPNYKIIEVSLSNATYMGDVIYLINRSKIDIVKKFAKAIGDSLIFMDLETDETPTSADIIVAFSQRKSFPNSTIINQLINSQHNN